MEWLYITLALLASVLQVIANALPFLSQKKEQSSEKGKTNNRRSSKKNRKR